MIKLSQKSTSSDTFDEIHQVVLDVISDNMASLVESVTYGAINTTETSTNGFYVIMFASGAYTIHETNLLYLVYHQIKKSAINLSPSALIGQY